MEAVAVGRAQRVKLGIPESAALDPRLGYSLGRLFLLSYLNEPQFEGGRRYAEDIVRDLKLSGLAIPSPKAQNIFAIHGREVLEEGKARIEAARQARHKRNVLRDILLSTGDINTGRRVLAVVYNTCILDEDCPIHEGFHLVRGLNRLATHYGI